MHELPTAGSLLTEVAFMVTVIRFAFMLPVRGALFAMLISSRDFAYEGICHGVMQLA